jgi:AcrR family transcriptional regulator
MGQQGRTADPPATPGVDARRSRWDGHRRTRRAELVEAAVRAIRRHGPNVGMDDIAAEAGVTKPVLYRHFTDKADLYLTVGRQVADSLLASVQAELDRGREPLEHLAAVIDAYLAAIEAEPELYRFVTRRDFADRPVEPDLVTDYTARLAGHVTRIVADHLRAAGLDPAPAGPWGHGVVGMVHAAGEWWLDHRAMSRGALTAHLTTLVWNGFAGVVGLPPTPVAAPE